MNYRFAITFSLPESGVNSEQYLDALYEAGCSDALVGVGQIGLISLDFDREASDAVEAVRSAIADVRKAIPDAQITEVSPDLVGMAEIAGVLGVTRQMVRKYTLSRAEFPKPVHASEAIALWHLVEVVSWAENRNKLRTKFKSDYPLHCLKELSAVAFKINFELQQSRQQKCAVDIIGAGNAKKLESTIAKLTPVKASGIAKKKTARRTERVE